MRRRVNTQGAKARRAMAIQIGRDLKRAGVKVGRKPIDASRLPNFDNFTGVMRGMGYNVRRENLRKQRRR